MNDLPAEKGRPVTVLVTLDDVSQFIRPHDGRIAEYGHHAFAPNLLNLFALEKPKDRVEGRLAHCLILSAAAARRAAGVAFHAGAIPHQRKVAAGTAIVALIAFQASF